MLRHFKEHKTAITSLAVGSSDDHVFSSSRDRSILCWDLARRRPRADAHARACPSGLPMLECAERPPQVQGARTTALVQRIGGINGIALYPDGTRLISVGQAAAACLPAQPRDRSPPRAARPPAPPLLITARQ